MVKFKLNISLVWYELQASVDLLSKLLKRRKKFFLTRFCFITKTYWTHLIDVIINRRHFCKNVSHFFERRQIRFLFLQKTLLNCFSFLWHVIRCISGAFNPKVCCKMRFNFFLWRHEKISLSKRLFSWELIYISR